MGSKRKRKQNKGHDFRNNRQQQHGNIPAVHKDGTVLFANPQGDYGDGGHGDKDSGGGPYQRVVNGQREAFPGLGDIPGDSDGDFLGPANDGIEYLRMVRSEAKGVPNLLMANQPAPPPLPPHPPTMDPRLMGRPIPRIKDLDILCYDDDPPVNDDVAEKKGKEKEAEAEEEGSCEEEAEDKPKVGGSGGFYSDGAYVAAAGNSIMLPSEPTHASLAGVPLRAVSREWHDGIVSRFRATRQRLRSDPPTPTDISIPFGYTRWMEFVLRTEPTPSNVAAFSSYDAIEGLKRVNRSLRKGTQISPGLGKWTWALLLQCDDAGILRNEEVGAIRELGKRASWLLGHWAKSRADAGDTEQVKVENEWWIDDDNNEEKEEEKEEEAQNEARGSMEVDGTAEEVTVSPLMLRPRSVKVPQPVVEDTSNEGVTGEMKDEQDTTGLHASMEEENDHAEDRPSGQIETQEDNMTSIPAEDEPQLEGAEANGGLPQEPLPPEPSQNAAPSSPTSRRDDAQEDPRKPTLRTLFTLDMILSVVGDVFGQKDLLLERR